MVYRFIPCLLSLCAAVPAFGAAADEVIGQRLKVSGTWDGTTLLATRMQERDADKDPRSGQIEGAIASVDADGRSMRIGPFTVSWDEATTFEGISAQELGSGVALEVSGELREPMQLGATSVEAGSDDLPENVVEIIGAVQEEEIDSDSADVAILGVPVKLPRAGAEHSVLTVRGDDRRPEEQLTVELFDRPLVVGGELGVVSRYRDNFSLDGAERLVRGDLEAQVELFYPFAPHAAAFAEVKALNEAELYQADGDRETERALERGEMWVYLDGFWDDRLAVQVGRQNFAEDREWWWDADLDALRMYFNAAPWSLELATARELGRISTLSDLEPAEEDVSRVLGRAVGVARAPSRGVLLPQSERSFHEPPGGRRAAGRGSTRATRI